jgi:hypothetical protein
VAPFEPLGSVFLSAISTVDPLDLASIRAGSWEASQAFGSPPVLLRFSCVVETIGEANEVIRFRRGGPRSPWSVPGVRLASRPFHAAL